MFWFRLVKYELHVICILGKKQINFYKQWEGKGDVGWGGVFFYEGKETHIACFL